MADSSLYGNQFSSILDAHIQSLQNEYQENQKENNPSSVFVFDNTFTNNPTQSVEENPLLKNVARSFSNSFFNFQFFGSSDAKQPSPLPDSARKLNPKKPNAAMNQKKGKKLANQPQPIFPPPSSHSSVDNFLQNCFGIFENSDESELDTEDDHMATKLRFAYPNLGPEDGQHILLIGRLQACMVFIDQLPREDGNQPKPLDMFELKNSKLALCYRQNLVFFLGVPLTTPDYFVKKKLEYILEAMEFFNGPLEHVQQFQCPAYFFYEQLKTMYTELVPMIQQQIQFPSSNFNAIPYLEFPYIQSNSLYLMASQCMRSLQQFYSNQNYFGSCIILEEQVITTQWDSFITNMIIYRIKQINSFIKNQPSNGTMSVTAASEEISMTTTISDADDTSVSDSTTATTINLIDQDGIPTPISSVNNNNIATTFGSTNSFTTSEWYMDNNNNTTNTTTSMISSQSIQQSFRSHILFSQQERIDYFPIYFSTSRYHSLLQKLELEPSIVAETISSSILPEFMKPSKEGIYLGAIVFRYETICMSVLVPLHKLVDQQFIQSIRNQTRDRLKQIEKKIKQHSEYMALNSVQQQQIQPLSKSLLTSGITTTSTTTATSSTIPTLSSIAAMNTSNNNLLSSNNSTTGSVQQLPPSVLLFDSLQEMVNGGSINDKFLEECSMAHELFEKDDKFCKVILKNSNQDGFFYAKKMFGSQIYCKHQYTNINVVPPLQMMQPLQQQQQQTQGRNRQGSTIQQQQQPQENVVTLDKLEGAVRESIKKLYKINII